LEEINPPANRQKPLAPEHFGDSWDEPLSAEDKIRITNYFRSIPLHNSLDFIRIRIGCVEHTVELNSARFNRGLTFEAPRHSFMTAIEYEIFDDLLIGNFMKVTLHGKFSDAPLYPDFTPYVTKYADNGRAQSAEELARYFAAYRSRYPAGYLRHQAEKRVVGMIRYPIEEDGSIYKACARTYHWLKALRQPSKFNPHDSIAQTTAVRRQFNSAPAHQNQENSNAVVPRAV
jgi:hypothetical protein